MANTMTTFIKIKNLNEENYSKIRELFKTEMYHVDEIEHFNKLFDEKFNNSDNVINRDFMDQNIGSKWINIEFHDDRYSSEVEVIIESAWNVPIQYLKKLRDVLTEWDKDITLSGTYEDEEYSPIGAFIYAFDYDYIEDYDGVVDVERMWGDDDDDDEYKEGIYDELYSLRDDLYESYLKVKKEREELE